MDYSYSDIARILQQQGDAFTDFKSEQDRRITHLEAKAGRPHIFGNAGNDRTEERKSLTAYFNALCSGDQAKANKHLGEIKSMSVGSDPDGGYLVTPTLSTDMTRIKLEISPFLGLAREVEIDGDAFEEPIDRDDAGAELSAKSRREGRRTPRNSVIFGASYMSFRPSRRSRRNLSTLPGSTLSTG